MLSHRPIETTGDSARTIRHTNQFHKFLRGVRKLFLLVLYNIIIIPFILFVFSKNTEESDFDQNS